MINNNVKASTHQRFQKAYLESRNALQRINLDLNRHQVIIVSGRDQRTYHSHPRDH